MEMSKFFDGGSKPFSPSRVSFESIRPYAIYRRYTGGIRAVYGWYTGGIRVVYGWYTGGIRRYTVVYGWYTGGIRRYTGGIRVVYGWYTGGIRAVYGWYTGGIRVVYAGYCYQLWMFDPRLHRHKKGCTLEPSMDLKSNRYEIDFNEIGFTNIPTFHGLEIQ